VFVLNNAASTYLSAAENWVGKNVYPRNPRTSVAMANGETAWFSIEGAVVAETETSVTLTFDEWPASGKGDVLKSQLMLQDEALHVLTALINSDRNNTFALTSRACVWHEIDDPTIGLLDIDAALKIEPTAARWIVRGNLCMLAKEFVGAVNAYNEAIRLDPFCAVAHNQRGMARRQMGEEHLAVKDFTRTLKLNPASSHAFNNRAWSLIALGEYKAAVEDCNRALEVDPTLFRAYENRCHARLQLRQAVDALTDGNLAVELRPDSAWGHEYRGWAKFLNHDDNGAKADFERAIELSPSEPTHRCSHSFVLVVSKDPKVRNVDEGLEEAERVLTLNMSNPYALTSKAIALASKKQFTDAINAQNTAVYARGFLTNNLPNGGKQLDRRVERWISGQQWELLRLKPR
jgi:tetratricopeptide (TPR) repeat protein